MDDEEEQELQNEQGQGEEFSGNNFASQMAEDARGIAQNARDVSEKLGKAAENQAQKAVQKTGVRAQSAQRRSEKLKKAAEKAKKVAEKAEKFAKFAAKIGKFIAIAGIFILIAIIIIGLLVFIIAGWGIIMSGLKGIVADFWDAVSSVMWGAQDNVHDEEIVDLMDTIEEMGYDLYGYGFVSSTQEEKDENGEVIGELCYERQETQDDDGNITSVTKLIKDLEKKGAYNQLKTYLVSDNYAYLLKNENINLKARVGSFFSGIFDSTEWGTGLISVYQQKDDEEDGSKKITGRRGSAVASIGSKLKHGAFVFGPGGAIIEGVFSMFTDWDGITSSVSIDREAKTLDIEAIGITSNQVFHYNLDGWTGRYSMPLEFLLATHIATMAPDLSYKLATNFNTDVEILLWKAKDNQMTGGIETSSGVIPYNSFKEEFGLASWVNGRKEAAEIFKNYPSLHSQTEGKYRCTGATEVEPLSKWGSATYEVDGFVASGQGLNDDGTIQGTSIIREFNSLKSDDIVLLKQKIKESFSDFSESVNMDIDLEFENEDESSNKRDMKTIIDEIFPNHTNSDFEFDFNDAQELPEGERNQVLATLSDGKYYANDTVNDGSKKYYYLTTIELTEFNQENIEYELQILLVLSDFNHEQKFDRIRFEFELLKNISNVDDEEKLKYCSDLLQDDIAENDPKKTCQNCYKYIQKLYLATKALTDKEFDVFVPYINSVTDHWFRNVYFTYGALEQYKEDNNLSEIPDVVVTDEEYYLSTGEMWTMYEMDPNGDYELYVYQKEGNDYSNTFATANGKYLICREEEGGPYGISDDARNMYVRKSNGGYALALLDISNGEKSYTPYNDENITEFKVGKKAITKKIEDKDWNVYTLSSTPKTEDWKPYEYSSNDDSDIQAVKDMEDITLVYQLTGSTNNITQTEDGVRGETNPIIKKLFLDDYYLYDGTGSTAALIEKAKEMADDDDPDVFKRKFGENEEIRATYQGKEYGPVKIKDISGPVNILQNSLTAFSMLKNMHTLDAEYIYHDFKELIVELDYFDKEDLTEAQESVMMFPIAGISSAGWPNVRFDKSEEFYGTLLHSAQDYAKKKEEAKAELAELFGIEEVEEEGETEEPEDETTPPTTSGTNASEIAGTSGTVASSNLLVQAAADIMRYMQSNDYAYCQGAGHHSNPEEEHSGRSCYRAPSFEDSQTAGHNLIDCSGFVSWCLQEVGILPEGTLLSSSTIVSANALADYYHSGGKASYSEYSPGTILIYSGHVNIYAGNGVFYDAGSTNSMMKSPRDVSSWRPASSVVGYIEIPNNKMTYNGITGIGTVTAYREFEGYEGGEAVLAPVTGEVIKYGTVERTNLETGEKEDTGFIKIRVLGDSESAPGTVCDWFDEEGYNYFWEEYANAGITNHVLYIEGFDVSQILTRIDQDNSVNGDNISNLSKYIQNSEDNDYQTAYKIPRTVNQERRKELEAKEQAKQDAAYTVKDGEGKIYIKEGAVIGYTYTADQAHIVDGVGNYMRMIFRDKEEQVVENVEDYIEIDSAIIEGDYSELEDLSDSATREEKIKAAMGYYMNQGFTVEAAAGIIGNAIQESGLNPSASNGGNYLGIFQWDANGRWPIIKDWMISKGYNENSFAGQIRAGYEANDRPGMNWEEFKVLTDVRKAAEFWCVYYEGAVGGSDSAEWYHAGNNYQELEKRKSYAQEALEIFNGNTTTE